MTRRPGRGSRSSSWPASPAPAASDLPLLLGAIVRGTLTPADVATVPWDAAHLEILLCVEASYEVHRGKVNVGAVCRALRWRGWPTGARCYALRVLRAGPTRAVAMRALARVLWAEGERAEAAARAAERMLADVDKMAEEARRRRERVAPGLLRAIEEARRA